MATKYMGLKLPVPGVTKGPTWAEMINTVFQQIDRHDHTGGKGKFIPTSAISVGSDIDFTPSTTAYGIKNAKYFQFTDLATVGTPDAAGSLFNWKGDLWWQYSSTGTGTGTFVRITAYDQVYSTSCSLEPIHVTASAYIISAQEKISAIWVESAPTTITLPLADFAGNGRYYLIQDVKGDASTNNITVTPSTGDAIGTATAGASVTISTNYGYKWLMADTFYNRWLVLTEN